MGKTVAQQGDDERKHSESHVAPLRRTTQGTSVEVDWRESSRPELWASCEVQRPPRRPLRRAPRRRLPRGARRTRRRVLHPRGVEGRSPSALVVPRKLEILAWRAMPTATWPMPIHESSQVRSAQSARSDDGLEARRSRGLLSGVGRVARLRLDGGWNRPLAGDVSDGYGVGVGAEHSHERTLAFSRDAVFGANLQPQAELNRTRAARRTVAPAPRDLGSRWSFRQTRA